MTHRQSRIRRAFVGSVLCGVFRADRDEDVDELELVLRRDRRAHPVDDVQVLAVQMSLELLLVGLRAGADWAVEALLFFLVLSQGEVGDVVLFATALEASKVSVVGARLCMLNHHQDDFGGVRVTLHVSRVCGRFAEVAVGGAILWFNVASSSRCRLLLVRESDDAPVVS